MFKLLKREETRQKIEFEIPSDSGEAVQKAFLFATFKVQPRAVKRERDQEVSRLARQAKAYIQGDEAELEMQSKDRETEYLVEDITDLEGVQDPESDSDLPYSEELLRNVLEKDYVRDAFMDTWKEIQNNKAFRKESKAKN